MYRWVTSGHPERFVKVISIWQPFASLIIEGHKFVETRGWAAPRSIIKSTIGIAATKVITPDQRAAVQDPLFARYYAETGLPSLDALPRGAILGTVYLNSCDLIDDETMEDVTEEERAFGWWTPGRYAWRLRYPQKYKYPISARGAQGVWDYFGNGKIERLYEN